MTNNPRWLYLLEKIAGSWDDGDRSLKDNRIDKEVHRTILDTLILGKPLSPKQSAALIRSIQRRVPFQSSFNYTGEIVLTRKQVRYANVATISRIRKAFTAEPQGFATDANGTDLSPISHPNASALSPESQGFDAHLSANSSEKSLEALHTKDSSASTILHPHFAPLNSDTQQHETTLSELVSSVSPTGHDAPTSHHESGTSTQTRVVHIEPSALGIGESSIESDKRKPAHKLGEVALWLDKGLTGTIYVDGVLAQLDFINYHQFEQRYYSGHSSNGLGQWWKDAINEITNDLVEIFRSGKGTDDMDYRFAVSGILRERGSSGLLKMGWIARLLYGENGEPNRLMVIAGDEVYKIGIVEGKGTKAQSPHWKGDRWEVL